MMKRERYLMKKYLLFSGDMYYPCGGWDDFQGEYDTIEEAKEIAEKQGDEWWQIVDLATREVITN